MAQKNKRIGEATSMLFRCSCGTVYDRLQRKTCPNCRKKAEALVATATTGPSQAVGTNASERIEPTEVQDINFRKLLYIAIGILGVAAILSPGSTPTPAPHRRHESSPSNTSVAPGTEGSPYSPGTTPTNRDGASEGAFTPDLTPGSTVGTVDPRIVGLWEIFINRERWTLDIGPEGTYKFLATGGGLTKAHQGTFTTADDSTWQMVSNTVPWQDGGRYQLVGKDILTTYGKLGTGQWHRVKSPRDTTYRPAEPSRTSNRPHVRR
ncbi:MAG: hypothetical protein KDD44_05490 [Bdellovibrionales bacterium]|nr:hypothetical protein [Bdellovibrionales bacterium]